MSQMHKDVNNNALDADSTEVLDECLKKYSLEDFQNMKLNGLSVTHRAFSQRKIKCIRFLAKKSQTVAWIQQEFQEKAPGGKPALHYALKDYPRPGKEPKSGKKKKANRRQKEQEEFIAKFTEILKIFKENSISLNLRNSQGSTVLELMIQSLKYNNAAVLKMIQSGADAKMIVDDKNNLLITIAIE